MNKQEIKEIMNQIWDHFKYLKGRVEELRKEGEFPPEGVEDVVILVNAQGLPFRNQEFN